MEAKNWRVDFREKGPDQERFHKAFTFTLAKTERAAKGNIIFVRPESEIEILKVEEVPR